MKNAKGLNRDYWLFWFASSLGMGASNILQYVLSLYVLDLTGSATLFQKGAGAETLCRHERAFPGRKAVL